MHKNTVCDLNKKKELLDEKMKESDQTRVSDENGETGEKVRSRSCNENNDEIGASGDEFRVNSVEISSDCDDCNSESGDVDSVKNHDAEDVMIEQIIDNGKVNSENGNEVGMDERFHAAEKDNTDVNDSQPKSYNVTKQNKATYAVMNKLILPCDRNEDGMNVVLKNSPWMKSRGRIGFARVLVEVDAGKQFKEGIDVQYRDNNGNIYKNLLRKRPRSSEELEQMVNGKEEQQTKDKFTEIQRKKNQQNNMNKQNQQNNYGRRNFGANIAGSRMTSE
ncbi:hypothetical protein Tco_1111796 [Tanacetum coccineum]|uniref:Uncharacterized protein n=1 Tax=Tanacetum coccineum TaxID=301880 RepID=A0ABQ5IQH0_9ASTR